MTPKKPSPQPSVRRHFRVRPNREDGIFCRVRVREYTYRHPEIVDRQLVAISFDSDGFVSNIERFGLEDGRVIALNRRVTDVAVESPGLIRQLLGSIGNITADDLSDGQ